MNPPSFIDTAAVAVAACSSATAAAATAAATALTPPAPAATDPATATAAPAANTAAAAAAPCGRTEQVLDRRRRARGEPRRRRWSHGERLGEEPEQVRQVAAECVPGPAVRLARARVESLAHGELGSPHVLQQEAARVVPPGRPVDEQRVKPQAVVERQGRLVVFLYLRTHEQAHEQAQGAASV